MKSDQQNKIMPVIMSGGSGTRLWPLSRQTKPKQFLPLYTDQSLLQETVARLDGIHCQSPFVICNEEHRFLVAEQLRQIDQKACILLEPMGRNTAAAIALAAFKAVEGGENPILLILAADHLIEETHCFQQCVTQAVHAASHGYLVTLGIVPNKPETGYGYIEKGQQITEGVYQVSRFVEKPDEVTAQAYIQSGDYYWNSGMFVFAAQAYLEQLQAFRPDIYTACKKAMEHQTADMDFIRVDKEAFIACPSESIDYAVMEKTQKAVMIPLDAGWTDIGSWSALWEVSPKDEQGNSLRGDVLVQETENTLVYADNRLVVTLGVQDIIVVETKDAVLVADKNSIQQVKDIVNRLQQQERREVVQHNNVHRPWGEFDSIGQGARYQVKKITVNPGARLSLQLHHYRAEHWIVVKGTAKVTNGEETYFLTENQSTFIPVGQKHSLENPGKLPLELIEVQSGSYLGEDDIVRFVDDYGRN